MRAAVVTLGDLGRSARMQYHARALAASGIDVDLVGFAGTALPRAIADEPRTASVIKSYESRMSAELGVVVGTSRVPLEGRAVRLRAAETNLGNLVADARLESGECRIKAGDNEVDAGCLQRLEACMEQVDHHLQIAAEQVDEEVAP